MTRPAKLYKPELKHKHPPVVLDPDNMADLKAQSKAWATLFTISGECFVRVHGFWKTTKDEWLDIWDRKPALATLGNKYITVQHEGRQHQLTFERDLDPECDRSVLVSLV